MLDKIKEKLGIKKPVEPTKEVDESKKEQTPIENVEETKKVEDTKKVEETENGEVKEQEQSVEPNQEDATQERNGDEPQVTEAEPIGNGMRIDDLVTKDEFADRIASLEAKLDAVIKENVDLKNQNSELKDKYEEKDFGVATKKGSLDKDDSTKYSSFDEYSKNFI